MSEVSYLTSISVCVCVCTLSVSEVVLVALMAGSNARMLDGAGKSNRYQT